VVAGIGGGGLGHYNSPSFFEVHMAKKQNIEDRVWIRGYDIAHRIYGKDIRSCRIFAMAYSQGFKNGLVARRRREGSYGQTYSTYGIQMGN
jgi:hypothetical protein